MISWSATVVSPSELGLPTVVEQVVHHLRSTRIGCPQAWATDDRPGPLVHCCQLTATQRLVRTVDGLTDDDWPTPSLLPDWTRAHVVAHLALNAEGSPARSPGSSTTARSRCRCTRRTTPATPTSPSSRRGRQRAPGRGCMGGGDRLRRRSGRGARGHLVDDHRADARRADLPGRRPPSAMRLREVEIHHADLGAGYRHADWPPEFTALLLDAMAKRGAAAEPFRGRTHRPRPHLGLRGGWTDRHGLRRRARLVADRPRRRRPD